MHAFTNNMTLFCVSQSAVFILELQRLYNACVYDIGIADDVLHNYYNVK